VPQNLAAMCTLPAMIASSKGEDPVWHELLAEAIVPGYLDTLE